MNVFDDGLSSMLSSDANDRYNFVSHRIRYKSFSWKMKSQTNFALQLIYFFNAKREDFSFLFLSSKIKLSYNVFFISIDCKNWRKLTTHEIRCLKSPLLISIIYEAWQALDTFCGYLCFAKVSRHWAKIFFASWIGHYLAINSDVFV